jgi:hypothetical protein
MNREKKLKLGGILFALFFVVGVVVVAILVATRAAAIGATGPGGANGPNGANGAIGPGVTQGPSEDTNENDKSVDPIRQLGLVGGPVSGALSGAFVPSMLDVGVNRASVYQADDSVDVATLGARLDYEEAEAAATKRETNAAALAVGRAIERRIGDRVVEWGSVINQFSGIDPRHVAWLRGLMAPARLDAGKLDPLAGYTAAQRLALVRGWNAGARFRFLATDTGSASGSASDLAGRSDLVLPRAKKTSGPFGEFAHTTWTADARTANGYSVYMGTGGIPAKGFACIRCPDTGATAIPFGERTAKQIPDGVTDPGLGVRDAYVYRPPTNAGDAPGHLASHVGGAALMGFPWEPYESYAELIARTARSGFKRTKLLNTGFVEVRVPSLFAVYLTPHYHGYHASTQSCHRGFGLFRASKDVATSCFDAAYGGVVYGTCPDTAYVRCAKETPYGATSTQRKAPCTTTQWMPGFGPDGTYVPGVLLMNDDVGSEWLVRPGDVVHKKMVRSCDGKTLFPETKAPMVVSCCAAWNYAVFPHYGVVRSNPEPWSGDMPPTRDAVGNVACATRDLFVEYHRGLGIVVAFRSDLIAT